MVILSQSLLIAVHLLGSLLHAFSVWFKLEFLCFTYYFNDLRVKQNRKVCVRFEAPQTNSLISCINDQRCEYVCENNKDSNNLVT